MVYEGLETTIKENYMNITLTEELYVKHAQDFDWTWEAAQMFDDSKLAEYKAQEACLQLDYTLALAPIRSEHNKDMNALREAYEKLTYPDWLEYNRQIVDMMIDYSKQKTTLWAKYNLACAKLFYSIMTKGV